MRFRVKKEKKQQQKHGFFNLYVLEGISFGLVDGAICALGAVVGIATATNDAFLAFLSVLIFGLSDSFGNSIGFYLSQVSERNIQIVNKRLGMVQHVHTENEILMNGVFSFISTIIIYVMIGIPFVFLSIDFAILTSTLISTFVVFTLGAYNAIIVKGDVIRQGIFYSLLTLGTAFLCYLFGTLINRLISV